MADDKQLLIDMERHFADRLWRQIEDHSDTCQRAGIAPEDFLRLLMIGLYYELLEAAEIAGWDEEAFVNFSRTAYRTMMPQIRKARRKRTIKP